jgi:hypothetical protein
MVPGHNGGETYVFALHEPTQTFELYRVSDHHMYFSRPASPSYNNYYRVRVEVQASTLSFLVNNAIVAKIPNTLFADRRD